MAWTTAELIAVFRLTVPALSDVTDAQLALDFEIYRDYVSERRLGRLFPKALSYFVAHMITLNQMIASKAGDGGAGNVNLTAGGLTSEKEGQLARGYSSTTLAAAGSAGDDLLKKTLYGQQFLMLRDMVIVPAAIRTGRWFCGGCRG